MKKIVDCFPFFNEKELLELRVNLLKDHVDEFIISELNYTHSGNPKEFLCKKYIKELNLPEEKIKVVEITIDNQNLSPTEFDYIFAADSESLGSVLNWTRERIQRDGILSEIEKYDDDTVLILSDCDEIINPDGLEYFATVARECENNTLKIPLVSLEGRADKRLYDGNTDTPCDWDQSLVLCRKNLLSLEFGTTPTTFRANFANPFSPVWLTENGEVLKDCGWHFSWMGDSKRRKLKSESIIHASNLEVYDNLSSDSIENLAGHTNNFVLKDYPVQELPQIIFDLPRVRDFLLPETNKSETNKSDNFMFTFLNKKRPTVWVVDDFYDDPHAVREFALKQNFIEGGIGRGFIGRRTEKQFLWPGLKESFESIIGQKITKWEEHYECGKFQGSIAGEPLVWHCDSQKWGGMLYLTPDAPYQCGTTLYAHKKTRARSYHEDGWDAAWLHHRYPGDPHLDGTHFEPVDVIGNVFNRLMIFDASCIHSASEYFGGVLENGRLWQMFFFDT